MKAFAAFKAQNRLPATSMTLKVSAGALLAQYRRGTKGQPLGIVGEVFWGVQYPRNLFVAFIYWPLVVALWGLTEGRWRG